MEKLSASEFFEKYQLIDGKKPSQRDIDFFKWIQENNVCRVWKRGLGYQYIAIK